MNSWDRQPCDTEDSWAAFKRYRDSTPPRKALRLSGATSYEQTARWLRENRWVERVRDYDNHLESIRAEETTAALRISARDAAAKHFRILHDMGDLAAREVEKLLKASKAGDAIGLLKPNEITALVDAVLKFDRLVRELPTEIVDVKPSADLSKLSPEDLRQLMELQRKMQTSAAS